MKTTEELVRELADREAIRDLPIRYCDCIFRKDAGGLVNLFTKDGVFIANDAEQEVATRGRTQLARVFRRLIDTHSPQPFIHTHVVELKSPTSAAGRCHVELRNAKIQLEWIGTGYYEDEYVKVGDEWKIASRRLVETGMAVALRNFMPS